MNNRKYTYLVIFLIIVGSLVLFISAQDKQGDSVKLLLQQAKEWVLGQEQQAGLTESSALVKKGEFLYGSVMRDDNKLRHKYELISIDGEKYEVSRIRDHLKYVCGKGQKRDKKFIFWSPQFKEIKYMLFVQKGLDLEHIYNVFIEQIKHYEDITDLTFVNVTNKDDTPYIFFTVSKSFSYIKDGGFVRHFLKPENMTEQNYTNYIENLDNKNATEIYKFKADYLGGLKALSFTSVLSSLQWNKRMKDNGYCLECLLTQHIYTSLSTCLVTSPKENMKLFKKDLYYSNTKIQLIDALLLKILYQNPQISGMSLGDGLNVVINEMVKKYGVAR